MIFSTSEPILSRHRLPQPYRSLLTLLWTLPPLLLAGALALGSGAVPFDGRLLLMLILMLLPACYIWREGIDITPSALIRRIQVPRRYGYCSLEKVTYDRNAGVLRVWDAQGEIAVECREAHVTDFEGLRTTLEARIRVYADDR